MTAETQYVLVCKEFNGSDCIREVWTVKPPDLQDFFEFDRSDFASGFSSILGLFAIGFGVGVVTSVFKKAR